MIYLIKGKNGAGKTFLADKLYQLGYNRSISCTTRAPRENEVDGYDYVFLSKEEFERKISENFFVEYQQVNENYYGTPMQNLKDGLILVSSDQNDIEHNYKGDITTFYIDAPLELRYKRVKERGMSENEIFNRFTNENTSFLYDFKACFIDNGAEEQSLSQILNNIDKTHFENNKNFLYKSIKRYKPIEAADELLTFLQFEEFLMRGIFLDNKIKSSNINEKYFYYMSKFLRHRNINFEKLLDGKYIVSLNGNKYLYTIDKNKIMKKGEKETDERKID